MASRWMIILVSVMATVLFQWLLVGRPNSRRATSSSVELKHVEIVVRAGDAHLLPPPPFFPQMTELPEVVAPMYSWRAKSAQLRQGPARIVADPCFEPPLKKVTRPFPQGCVNMEDDCTHMFADGRKLHTDNVRAVLLHQAELLGKVTHIAQRIQRDNTVVVMPINRGYFDFFLNWWASTQLASINIGNLLMFPGDEVLHLKLLELGFNSFFHQKLGDFPMEASRVYGDGHFTHMMWLKTISVWLVLNSGFNVLFQDADIVWFHDPVEFMFDERWMRFKVDGPLDAIFMDDGSRGDRYFPYFANTGFFFLRANHRTLSYWDTVMYSSDLTIYWQSQQQTVNHFLKNSCALGLKINVLSSNMFANGKRALQIEKGKLEKEEFAPVMWHLNYTPNRDVKVKRMAELGLWYLDSNVWPAIELRRNIMCNCSVDGRHFVVASHGCTHLDADCQFVKRLY